MALDYISSNSFNNKFVIFFDCLSVFKSLNQTSSKKHHEISKTKEILFCWLPSHVGIKDNEAADVKAKASLDLETSRISKFLLLILNLLSIGTSCLNGKYHGME